MNTITKLLACLGLATIWAVTVFTLEKVYVIPSDLAGWIWAFFVCTTWWQVDWVNSPQKQ